MGRVPSWVGTTARDSLGGLPLGRDKPLRDALIDFGDDSRYASPWAAKVYTDALARTRRPPPRRPHPGPRLGPRHLAAWQDGAAYDPAKHRGR